MTTPAAVSNTNPSLVKGLQCRECGKTYDKAPIHVCEFCFGPLEVAYDYAGHRQDPDAREDRIAPAHDVALRGAAADRRPARRSARRPGMTPLVRADRLAKRLGLKEVWVKNDAVSHPSLSFKDRVVSVAVSKAIEFGIGTIACASTGNLANATAAQAAAAGLPAVILIPFDLESGEGAGHQHLRRARGRRQGDVRRRQPPLLGDRGQVRLGVRQRQPAAVLRRGLEELRLRDRRAARLAAARAHRRADGGRIAGDQDRQGVRRAREAGPVSAPGAQAAHPRRPGGRLRADRRHGAGEPRPGEAGEDADQHREVAGDRQSGRRLLRAPDHHRVGRLGGEARRRRDRRRR